MSILRFQDREDYVEIELASQETGDLPSQGDACLRITVSAAGFAGQGDAWICAEGFRSFCQSLVALERDRRGEAFLESMSPDEFRLKVWPVDALGHMMVEGSLGRYVCREHSRPRHSVSFGFEFDPPQLVTAINVDWISHNAEHHAL